MKFSIVTIVYNDYINIESTILSCLNQTYQNLEYIIVDGNSDDGTKDVILKYMEKINKFISEKDNGIYDAMNKGLQLCSGDYVIFMNSGDTFSSNNVLFKIYDSIKEIKPDFLYGDTLIKDVNNNYSLKKARHHMYNWYGMFANHQSILYKLNTIKDNKLSYDLNFQIASDYKFTLQFLKKAKSFLKLEFPICVFSMDGVSNKNKNLGLKEANLIRKEILQLNIIQIFAISLIILFFRILAEKTSYIYNILRFRKLKWKTR